MKFQCERDRLAEALTIAGRAVSARASLPVLSGVHLELRHGTLRVTGSDLDLTISSVVDVDGDDDGIGVVNAKLLTDIVRVLDEGAVRMEVDDEEARISAGRSEFAVRTVAAAEFPNLPEPATEGVEVEAAMFAAAVRQVLPAASQDVDRPILRGVQMETEDAGVRLVATDSYRLSVRDLPGTTFLAEGQQVLVPRIALSEVARLLDDQQSLTLRLGERDATFEVGSTQIVTRLIEGAFPNYRSLIPSSHPNKLTVGRDVLLDAVRRVKVVARDTATPVRLKMSADGLELSVTTQDYGNALEQVDAKYEGSELTVAFNPEYLTAGVEAATGDEVTIETIDNLKPSLVSSPESPEYRYVLMPVRFP
ncbi:MAG: DNA polymerase III subunit beta [Acidimicrobiia bacterium]|nr:DNA polymerase III subunit beta [Acidimicrobiia bacterium]